MGLQGISSQPKGLPTGAIVGITIALVMLLLGAVVFFVRQRAVRNRKLCRGTATWLGANSSYQAGGGASAPSAVYTGAMDETSPGISLPRPAPAPPVPMSTPIPPTMPASSYNNPVPPPASLIPGGAAGGFALAGTAGSAANAATVRYEFIPSLPDELSITTGEVVRMLSEYDDGWALCKNARGEQGMVPLECLDRGSSGAGLQVEEGGSGNRNSRRTSSLRPAF
ncbi:hypothetical protein R3P38DRAFT_2905144 [Favolaschia claudopus]|uniref:SH3 domain-containing protein n=1 Tax=Favolaschia claudopus TaxID=2862362 RepID=A0AAW0CHV8_9AGAR